MTLLTDLDAFYTEHRRCGELEAGVDGPVVWLDCECGAHMERLAGGRGAIGGGRGRGGLPEPVADELCCPIPHPGSGGASDERADEAIVRDCVRGLLDGGVLPHLSAGHLLAAQCILFHCCTICGAAIKIKIREQEIEIISRTGAARIYLHHRCFDIWGEEASVEQARPSWRCEVHLASARS